MLNCCARVAVLLPSSSRTGGNFQGECALPNEKTPTVRAEMTVEVNSCVEYG